jgi:protocatechuate 3,4-dioxygenase beta subunit
MAQEMTVDGAKLDAVSTHTRADGSFELGELRRGLAHELVLRRDGFATLIFALADDDPGDERLELGEFTLAPGAAVDGRVVDESGAPLAGVPVDLTGFNEDWERLRPAGETEPPMSVVVYGSRPECTSGADGAFHFANLPAGRFVVSATRGRRETPVSAKIELASGELHAGVELRFVPRLAIAGRVVDPDGHPLPNASLDAWPEPPLTGDRSQAVALEDGRFALGGLDAGSYTVTVKYEGARFHEAGRVFLPTKREHVAAGTPDLAIVLAEGVRLRGRVNDHDGKPVERAVVKLLIADVEWKQAWSAADGHFEFVVPPETTAALEVRRLPPDATDRDLDAIAKAPPLAVVRDVVAEDGEVTVELPPAQR